MRTKLILLVSLAFAVFSQIAAQQSSVFGQIIDKSTSEPLIGATIKSGDLGITSDVEGKFKLLLPVGEHEIEISYVGYNSESISLFLSEGQSIEKNIQLIVSNTLLETATITSSRYEQRLAESTVSIDVVDNRLIESTNSITPDKVLDKLPGVQIIDDQANIRGGSGWSYGAGSRVLLLINDIPALQADAGLPQWADIPTENIAQIEVLKGAASALYGSAALNGIINVRTGYATSEPETKVSIFGNAYMAPKDRFKKWWTGTPFDAGASVLHKRKIGKWDVVAGLFYFNRDSTNTYAEQDFSRKTRLDMNLRYRATDRLTFSVNSFFNDGESSSFFLWGNGANKAYQPFTGTVSRSNNLRYIIDPQVTYFDKNNNKHKFLSRYYFIDNANNMGQSNASKLYYGEYQFQRELEEKDVTVTAGITSTRVRSDSDLFSDTTISSTNLGLYAQFDKRVNDKFNISLGTRYEYNQQNVPEVIQGVTVPGGKLSEGKLITRVGVNYEVSDYTFIRASWGQGYRYPTITERFILTQFGGFIIFPNPELGSETGWSSEFGIKQGFRFFNIEGFLDFSLFRSEYQDMAEFTFYSENGRTGFQAQNIGDTRIQGYELSVAGRSNIFSVPIRFQGGYTYIDPIYKNFNESIQNSSSVDENILKYRTKHQFTFDIEGEYKNVSLGLALLGASHMVAIDGILSAFATIGDYRTLNNAGYERFDARIAYKYRNWKLSILFNNILNEEYTERPAILEPPRNIGIRLDFKV